MHPVLRHEKAKNTRARLDSIWHSQDQVESAHEKTQSSIASVEEQTRATGKAVAKEMDEYDHQRELQLQLSRREAIASRERASRAQTLRHSDSHWKQGMQRGARMSELEKQVGQQMRRRAVRDFQWAKEDAARFIRYDLTAGTTHLCRSRPASTRLPTSPDPSGFSQSPGAWRVEQQNMKPGV